MINIPNKYYDFNDSDNTCYLCNKPRYSLLHEVKHFNYPFTFKKCQCGLIKQTPMPNKLFFEWFFNSDIFFSSKKNNSSEIWGYLDYFKDEPCRMATSQYRYKKLSYILNDRKPLKVMKIGPSTGTFLNIAQLNGHQTKGCDISSQFVSYARENYNIEIDIGRFEDMNYDNESFDVILLFNVIENVCNQTEFIECVNRTLKSGGYFIFNFVDMNHNYVYAFQKSKYFLFRPPICYMYTMTVMKKILTKFGFRLIDYYRDIRYLHIEKIATLLGWKSQFFSNEFHILNHKPFPIYAYPSKIVVAQKF